LKKIIEFQYHIYRFEFQFRYVDEQIRQNKNIEKLAKVLPDGSIKVRYFSYYYFDIRAALNNTLKRIKEDIDIHGEEVEKAPQFVTYSEEETVGEKDNMIDLIKDKDNTTVSREPSNNNIEGDGELLLLERNKDRRKKRRDKRRSERMTFTQVDSTPNETVVE